MTRFAPYTLIFAMFLLPAACMQAALPDLRINRYMLRNSIEVTLRTFSADECAVIERCVPGPGTRKILKFDASIINIGAGDLRIGNPASRSNLFHFSECHGHYHMKGFSSYELLNSSGTVVRRSRKQGFCLRDDRQYLANAPAGKFNCDNQGITRGWQDVYDKSLDCQFLDVTGVRPGRYTLRVTVNPQQVLRESNYGNNAVSVPVRIRDLTP